MVGGLLRFAILISLLKKLYTCVHTCIHTPSKKKKKIVERTSKEKNAFHPVHLYSSSFQTDMPKCMNRNAEGENQIRRVGTQAESGFPGCKRDHPGLILNCGSSCRREAIRPAPRRNRCTRLGKYFHYKHNDVSWAKRLVLRRISHRTVTLR